MTVEAGPRVITAEVALLALSGSVAVGAQRLFDDGAWVLPIALTVVVVHGTSAIVRRGRLGIVGQILAVALATFLLVSWVFAGETTWYGLPTTETLGRLGDLLAETIDEYPSARAPVPAEDGFVLALAIGLAIVALMADIAAFSLRATLQALIPPFTLFALCSLLGSGDARVVSALAFVVAALAFVLSMRGLIGAQTTTWMPGDHERGPNAIARLGTGLIAVAALGAVVVGPVLPGAADAALWTWRGGGGGPSSRQLISPLVDIQARLVNQSNEIVFIVESPQPAYWRMMSLDEFDGQAWRMSSSFRDVAGSFALLPPRDRTEVVQEVEIRALDSEYLPAAFEPTAIDVESGSVTFDDHSSTLLLDDRTGAGFEYTVTSHVPDFTADQLRATDQQLPGALSQRYLQLPDLDPRVVELARSVTADAATDYDRALALQDFFRTEFDYSLDIPSGSGEDAIVRFLFDHRAGYCEQFAGSFAAMARSLGIPTRVAVGYTEGDRSPNRQEFFTVRGGNAHAWPEVYFRGVGWVPFEPTPGRVSPGSSAWTNLDDEAGGADDPAEAAEEPAEEVAPTIPPELEPMLPDFDLGEPGGGAPEPDEPLVPPAVRVLLVVAAVVGAWFALVTGAVRLREHLRRRRVADDPAGLVDLAWSRAVDALARRGRTPRASETRAEYAERIAVQSPSTAVALADLAELSARARYSDRAPDADVVERADALAADVVRATTQHLPWYRRVVLAGDPRRLRSARVRRARRSATVVTAAP